MLKLWRRHKASIQAVTLFPSFKKIQTETYVSTQLPPSSQTPWSGEAWSWSWRHENPPGWLGGTAWRTAVQAATWTTPAQTLWLLSAVEWLCWRRHAGRCFCCWRVHTRQFPLPGPGGGNKRKAWANRNWHLKAGTMYVPLISPRSKLQSWDSEASILFEKSS